MKKEMFLGIVITVLVLMLILSISAAAFSGSGSGTLADPYQITDCTQLSEISNACVAHYKLMNNVNAYCISASMCAFSGSLNGNGYYINNLTLIGAVNGLFINLNGANISNLGIRDAKVVSSAIWDSGILAGIATNSIINNSYIIGNITLTGSQRVGGFISWAVSTKIINCSFTGIVNLTGVNGGAGGLVGQFSTNSVIRNSYSNATVIGTVGIGGLVGAMYDNCLIDNSYAVGPVTATTTDAYGSYAGGLVGSITTYSNITNSYATGNVKGITWVGGLVGVINPASASYNLIYNCSASGNVSGSGFVSYGGVGGLIGLTNSPSGASSIVISNSYSTGDVNDSADPRIGGLVGYVYAGTIVDSYSTGNIYGNYSVGGLVGRILSTGIINRSFATGKVNGISYSGGLVGESYANIYNSYASGTVSGSLYSGGLVGYIQNANVQNSYSIGGLVNSSMGGLVGINLSGTITNSYWNNETAGTINCTSTINPEGCDKKTSSQMKTSSTFSSWTTPPWYFKEGYYPKLKDFTATVPTIAGFKSSLTTDFADVADITSVPNMVIANDNGSIKWFNAVNAQNQNYDNNITIGDSFVSVNSAKLHSSINNYANITMNNINCNFYTIHYSDTYYTAKETILSNGQKCTSSTTPSCTNLACTGSTLTFTVSHFTSFAAGENSNLTIYDDYEGSQSDCSENISVYANYSNSTGMITGASCNLTFDDWLTHYVMAWDGDNYYNGSKSFTSSGTYTYKVKCAKTGYDTLQAVDDITISGQVCLSLAGIVPEFSTWAILLALTITVFGFFFIRKR